MCTVSTKCRRFAWSRYPEAFGSRIFNPLRWRPPTGGALACSGPPGRFQPAPVATVFRLRGDVPAVRPKSRRSVRILPPSAPARRAPRNRPTDTSRSTTPESRIGRRTCALPMPSGASSMRVVRRGEDQEGSRKFKALKSRDVVRYSPSIEPCWRGGSAGVRSNRLPTLARPQRKTAGSEEPAAIPRFRVRTGARTPGRSPGARSAAVDRRSGSRTACVGRHRCSRPALRAR